MNQINRKILCAVAVAAAIGLSGCEADGNASEGGGITDGGGEGIGGGGSGSGGGSSFPNDGTTPTVVTDGGAAPGGVSDGDGSRIPGRFICEASARRYGPNPETFVAANGLVGGPLTDVLNTVGGDTATRLLNSVVDLELAIDGDLRTASKFSLTAAGLFGVIDSVDQVVLIDGEVPSGNFAVFAVSFPIAALELSLLQQVRVTTFRDGAPLERAVLTEPLGLDLLGAVRAGRARAFVGVRTTRDYDAASVGLVPGVLSANVGDAMFVHELCTRGSFVDEP